MGDGILTPHSNYTNIALSNATNVNALLDGTRWLNDATTTLTYSFRSPTSFYKSEYSGSQEYLNSSELPETLKAAVRSALGAWARVANIRFVEVADSQNLAGDLRFGVYHGMPDTYAGWAYGPGATALSGDVWFNKNILTRPSDPGSFSYRVILHEIGHAIGLKHSHEGDSRNSTIMDKAWDSDNWTLMSYNRENDVFSATPQFFDIQAIQYLYGANLVATAGNDVHSLGNGDQAIWDCGGEDTLVCQIPGQPYSIDLTANSLSTASTVRYYVMPGTEIENAVGGSGGDTITGNWLNNRITGNGGNDTINGAGGFDTAVFSGNRADYTITRSGATTLVRDNRAGGDGTDSLTDVETLRFADQSTDANGGLLPGNVAGATVYRFYNRANGAHFFTSSTAERDQVRGTMPGYSYEGAVFGAVAASLSGASPVYRFYNKANNSHFYTVSAGERDDVINRLSGTYNYEGEAYHAFDRNSASAALDGVTPLYRFYNKGLGSHFFTASLAERDTVINTMSNAYTYEGIAYYVAKAAGGAGRSEDAAGFQMETALQGDPGTASLPDLATDLSMLSVLDGTGGALSMPAPDGFPAAPDLSFLSGRRHDLAGDGVATLGLLGLV